MRADIAAEVAALLEQQREALGLVIKAVASDVLDDIKEEVQRDRVVTLTIGQLTDALSEALKVVGDAEPRWKKGDRAFVEVEVTGTDKGSVNFKFADWKGTASFTLGADYLKEIA